MKNYFAVSAAATLLLTSAFLMVVQSPSASGTGDIQKFSSRKQFKEYVSSYPQSSGSVASGGAVGLQAESGMKASQSAPGISGSDTSRHSSTNVQVEGVGEPDILKNAGEKIFYSGEQNFYYYGKRFGRRNTSVFRPLPAENFSRTAEIPESGKMFLSNNSVVFLGGNITSYDRDSYERNWNLELNSSSTVSARKINSSIYLVLRKNVDVSAPCPVRPMSGVAISCTSFYRPSSGKGSSTTYNIVKIDAESGEVEKTAGFVGSGWNTVIYVSKDSIYLTYLTRKSRMEVMMNFLGDEGSKYFDQETLDRIDQLQGYNLSDQALKIEVNKAIQRYMNRLSRADRKKAREKFQNAWSNYTTERKRKLSKTGIARFSLDLSLQAQGSVPGKVNNQFSLSEKEGNLRIATTSGLGWRFNAEPANDLYILDRDLERKGQIQGLGLNEQIYAVRYIDDKAYIVTYKHVDPFHMVDISDPESPELVGQLKLPGFSSYLHPLSGDRILGIGKEDGKVKAVIFDVSGKKPEVEDSKVLDDWYSSISNSHHAFKIDRKHRAFFLPGSSGGHIFSYSKGLREVKKVNLTDPKRATYVNDYLYIFGDSNATVINENNWETVRNIRFREKQGLPGPVPRPPIVY
ncbi:MAG: beta-propeller domain-containing protein [Candidatus Nanohalobium sp.]